MIPAWLHQLSIGMLVLGVLCALYIAFDVARRPQAMWIMNVVWPLTALFGTVLTTSAYLRYGRLASKDQAVAVGDDGDTPAKRETPFPMMVAKGTLHCGSGCSLGDIIAEWLAFGVPAVAAWFGWHSLFQEKMFAVWVLDFLCAFVIGVAFQYFSIAPMRHLGLWEGIWQALKADTFSLCAWQVGMYGCMAIAQFWLFGKVIGVRLAVDTPEFWFVMQVAMLAGFVTAYPVNWWLLKAGIKETM